MIELTPQHCAELERRGRLMLGDKLETVIAACEFVRSQLNALPLGSCKNHAQALQWALRQKNIDCRVITGEAFWQVGPEPHNTISFCQSTEHENGFHCWIEIDTPDGPVSIDPTCYALAQYAKQEGVTMTWRPSPQLIWKSSKQSIEETEIKQAGAWIYHT